MKNKIQKLLEKDIQVGDGIEFTSKDSMGTQIVCVV